MTGSAPLGLRLNNPGNIRFVVGAEPWLGQNGQSQGFVSFSTASYGIRAIGKILLAYQDRHNIDTIRGAIARWAPAGDNNDVDAYVADVAARVGMDPDADIDFHDPNILAPLVEAIIFHEQGQCPFSNAMIEAAIGVPTASA